MRRPYFSLMSGGIDLIPVWGPLIISVTITDEKGDESDKLTVELDNRDGQCVYPGEGQIITASGGYIGEGATRGGQFEIDQVDFEGWPEKISINGTTVSASKQTKEKKTEAHKKEDTKTVGDLAKKIAGRNGWSPKVASKIASIPLEYEGQTSEFDTQFLNRVIRRFGGELSVKEGNLVISMAGESMSVSGLAMPTIIVAKGHNLLGYTASFKKRVDHGKAQAHTFDRKDVKRIDVDAGLGDITYRLREPFQTKEEAKAASEAKVTDLKRGTGSATFEIEGDPNAAAGCSASVSGCPSKVNGIWNVTRAEHQWQGGAYKVSLACETPASESGSSEGGSGSGS